MAIRKDYVDMMLTESIKSSRDSIKSGGDSTESAYQFKAVYADLLVVYVKVKLVLN